MNEKQPSKSVPTYAEMQLLQILWALGKEVTVREVHDKKKQPGVYTGTLKTLQIMMKKGFVQRKRRGRGHVYTPALDQSSGRKKFIKHLVTHVFGGSSTALILQVLSALTPDRSKLMRIRERIRELEGKAVA